MSWKRLSRFVYPLLAIALLLFAAPALAQDEEPPPAEEPPAEEPPAEEPPAEEPPAEEPPAEEPAAEEPPAEEPPPEEPPAAVVAPIPAPAPAPAPAPPPPAQQPPPPAVQPPPPAQQPPPPALQPVPEQQPSEQQFTDCAADDEDCQEQCAEGDEECDESVFGWFTFSPQVGAAIYPEADITVKGVNLTIEKRAAFVGKLHFDLGGDGLAFEIAPLIAVEGSGKSLKDLDVNAASGVGGGLGGDFVAFGGQLGLVFRIPAAKYFFPHVGIGFHGAYLTADSVEYGAELYGRIPVGFTWYWGESFALTVDVGFMYGATGIRLKQTKSYDEMLEEVAEENGLDPDELEDAPKDLNDPFYDQFDPEQRQALMESAIAQQARFGRGFGFDFMIGVRFP